MFVPQTIMLLTTRSKVLVTDLSMYYTEVFTHYYTINSYCTLYVSIKHCLTDDFHVGENHPEATNEALLIITTTSLQILKTNRF